MSKKRPNTAHEIIGRLHAATGTLPGACAPVPLYICQNQRAAAQQLTLSESAAAILLRFPVADFAWSLYACAD
jgi:hypothetical protein